MVSGLVMKSYLTQSNVLFSCPRNRSLFLLSLSQGLLLILKKGIKMRMVKNNEPKFVIKVEKGSISALALKKCLEDAGKFVRFRK